MRIRSLVAAAVLAPSVLSTVAATPSNCRDLGTDGTKVVCTQRVYFHCTDEDVKVGNVSSLIGDIPTFDTTPPSKSLTDGGGCGQLDTQATGTSDQNPIYDAPFAGYFEDVSSNIDSITIRAHVIDVGTARATPTSFTMRAHVMVDGVTVLSRDKVLKPKIVPSSTGLSREAIITVTGIGRFDKSVDHEVKVTLYAHYVDSNQNAWVWDTVEVPSGLEFNLPTPPANALVVPAFS